MSKLDFVMASYPPRKPEALISLDEKKAEWMFAEKPKEDLAKFSIFVNSFRLRKKGPLVNERD